MNNILFLIASPSGSASRSMQVAQRLVDKLRADQPGSTLTTRNLAQSPLPHIGEDFVSAITLPAAERTDAQRLAIERSDELVAELFAADTIVIASAMINFSISSTLKTWLDHVVRSGSTFRYSAEGPQGLVTGKKVFLIEVRGGVYSEGPNQAMDFQEPYLKAVLGFLGLTNVETIVVEGVSLGAEAAGKAMTGALEKIEALPA